MVTLWIRRNFFLFLSCFWQGREKLESELQTKNRFFPENRILKSIDGLIDAPHRILEKGTYIYRARKVDKYRENEIFKDFYKDIYSVIKEQIPDFDENAGNFE